MPSLLSLRVVATPPGPAPDTIRRAWHGVEIPLDNRYENGPEQIEVFSGNVPQTRIGKAWARLRGRSSNWTGYSVDGRDAIEALEQSDPEAARWWRDNSSSVVGNRLVFPADVCEVVEHEHAQTTQAEARGQEPGRERCEFCGKPRSVVRALVQGPSGVCICEACVKGCTECIAWGRHESRPPLSRAIIRLFRRPPTGFERTAPSAGSTEQSETDRNPGG